MARNPLSRFEALAQRLVEDSFGRLFGGQMEPLEIATRLARALEDSLTSGEPANHFSVSLNPADYEQVMTQHPDLEQRLAEYGLELARRAGVTVQQRPSITVQPDARLRHQQVGITAGRTAPQAPATTQVLPADGRPTDPAALHATLVIDGRRRVSLAGQSVTIGRRGDCDVVLDSAYVSRRHAELQWRMGHWILVDRSGRNRTRVNGQPISEHALEPGDVLTLSDVVVVYEEPARPRHALSDDQTPAPAQRR